MSEESDLPDGFDAIILGTGLCESVLAAAFSRVGYSVLHLDRNSYYGELESTHSLNGLLDYAKLHSEGLPCVETNQLDDNSICINIPTSSTPSISNLSYDTYDISDEELSAYRSIIDSEKMISTAAHPQQAGSQDGEEDNSQLSSSSEKERSERVVSSVSQFGNSSDGVDGDKVDTATVNPVVKACLALSCECEWGMEQKLDYLRKKSNKFILDLTPKLLFARSEMIDLLITSDVARYCEFRSVTQILTLRDKNLEVVPCSRSDIFSSKSLSMIEKRILMKLLTLCMEYETRASEYEDFQDKPFVEFLKSQKLTPNLLSYVLHAIAMVPPTASLLEGLQRTQLFLKSLGRYGQTPFLWPLYGGEINQAFCRMSAVFGGVYILHRTISSINIINEGPIVSQVICNEGKVFKCKWLITNADYVKSVTKEDNSNHISRAIVIASGSLSVNSDKEEAVLLSLPSLDGASDPVTVIELGPAACVCPKDASNLRVVHLTTRARATAQEDLQPYVDLLFSKYEEGDKPRLILACYFNIPDYSEPTKLLASNPHNLYITPGPDANINPDSSIRQAKRIFSEVCPGEEFLPRPPDPEDIIYCDDESKKQSEGESFSEEVNATSSQPSAGDHVTSSQLSTGDHVTSSQPSTVDHVTSSQQSAGDHVTSRQPSADDLVTSSQPSAGDHVTSSQPSAGDHVTSSQPSAGDHVTSRQPSADDLVTSSQPSAGDHVTSSQPSVGDQVTSSQPFAGDHVTIYTQVTDQSEAATDKVNHSANTTGNEQTDDTARQTVTSGETKDLPNDRS